MGVATVRKLLPSDCKVLLLEDFIRGYAPTISSSYPATVPAAAAASNEKGKENVLPEQLQKMIIAPLNSCRVLEAPSNRSRRPDCLCREPVRTLVDDIV